VVGKELVELGATLVESDDAGDAVQWATKPFECLVHLHYFLNNLRNTKAKYLNLFYIKALYLVFKPI